MIQKAPAVLTAAMAALLACADPTSPAKVLQPGDVSLAVTQELFTFPSPGFPANVGVGGILLCKKVSPGDPGGTFTFTVTSAGTGILNAAPELVVPAGGEDCELVYRSPVFNVNVDQVVITEDAPPANWALVGIDTKQLLDQAIVNANGYPAPRLDDTESVPTRTATLYINNDMGRIVTFTNDFTPPPGGQGCTPGYWKQPHHFDSWPAPFLPGNSFNTTFGIGTNWFLNSLTLAQAAGLGGGQENALARHAVAALLNAASGFTGFTTTQVIAAVQAAYANASLIESTKNLFADFNEQRCPLN